MSLIVFQPNTMHAVVGETVKPGASNRRRFVGVRSVMLPGRALTFDSVGKNRLLCLFIASDVAPCLRFGLPRPQERAFGATEQARWRLRTRRPTETPDIC
jgi:hypothetical protein